jgi:chaperone modulatory protein CbpM
MKTEIIEGLWLDERQEIALTELAELSGIPEAELLELADYGAIAPIDPGAEPRQWTFTTKCLVTVRTACRLRESFELDPHDVALVVTLLDRIQDLEAQLRDLRAQLPHRNS